MKSHSEDIFNCKADENLSKENNHRGLVFSLNGQSDLSCRAGPFMMSTKQMPEASVVWGVHIWPNILTHWFSVGNWCDESSAGVWREFGAQHLENTEKFFWVLGPVSWTTICPQRSGADSRVPRGEGDTAVSFAVCLKLMCHVNGPSPSEPL